MYVCVSVCECVCAYVCVHACMHARHWVPLLPRKHVAQATHPPPQCPHWCAGTGTTAALSLEGYGMGVLITRMYLFTCVHACVSTCMCVCEIGAWGACALYACMHMYVFTCTCVCACESSCVCVCACFVMGYGL